MPQNNILASAMEYLHRGWSVVPMRTAEKKPATKWTRYQTERADEAKLRSWFASQEDYGIAVIFGEVSGGLGSRDFDEQTAYERWATANPKLAKTLPTVETRRGCHVYFRAVPDTIKAIRKRLRKPDGKGAIKLADGELRVGVGCYSLLPPSKHPSGHVYQWKNPTNPPTEFPLIDPIEAGFLSECESVTQRTQRTQSTQKTQEDTSNECEGVFNSNFGSEILRAIDESLPTGAGKRHRQVFELARTLKAITSISERPANELRAIVKAWHKRALPCITTKAFDETWIDFLNAWPRVRFPRGKEPLKAIFEKAIADDPPLCAAMYEQVKIRNLVSLCRSLQRLAGAEPFFLDCRSAAKLVDVSHTQAARWLFLLVADGVLIEVEKGSKATRKASSYLYAVRDGPAK